MRGLRVYAPDDTAAMFVPFHSSTMTACGKDGELEVRAVKAGTNS